jgi:outer membrane protein OmpA-like peptidoglycan-associated protein
MPDLFESVGRIAGLAGISCGVLLLVFRDVIRKNIFPTLTKGQAYKTLNLVIALTFFFALAGIGAWLYNGKVTRDEAARRAQHDITPDTATDLKEINDKLLPLYFERGQNVLTDRNKAALRQYAEMLANAKAGTVEVTAYVDEQKPTSNTDMTYEAAMTVADYLAEVRAKLGLPSLAVVPLGMGALDSIKPKGSAYNNRVELHVTRLR